MSKEVIDYCANEECNKEIFFGQPVWKIGYDLVCSTNCLLRQMGAKTVIAGRDDDKPEPCVRCNFNNEFITDYDAKGKEFRFCGNCGQPVEEKARTF